jgi:ribonucleoside-triphosphate reductase (formate)
MAKEIKCPQCGSKNVDGISRVVGYFSLIKNWNKSKQGELKARKKGNYKLESSE